MTLWIPLTVVAVVLLLVADARDDRRGVWIWKPLASTGFVATALALLPTDDRYGRHVLWALMLCWLGDVLLIPRARAAFAIGLASFLAGHVLFATAFLVRGVALLWLVVVALLLIAPVLLVDRWLAPHVPASLRLPVRAYVVAICAMVACAFGTYGFAAARCGGAKLLLGALMFFFSDLSVARDRFVAPGFVNRLWGLPLYYGGQLLLATSVAWC
jgi:uncharacterized membrane protein YhhN